jgi:hypothetical protein
VSAEYCGCDADEAYVCKRHQDEALTQALQQRADDLADMMAVAEEVAQEQTVTPMLPTDAAERKATPIATGVLDYFPLAIAEIARVSKIGNDQHNPGQPLHWDRAKSRDEADALLRHFMERGKRDSDGCLHTGKMAWRALAMLQKELEGETV